MVMPLSYSSIKNSDLKFVINPENGKWIYTNNPTRYEDRVSGSFKMQPLKGTRLIVLNIGRDCNLRCKYCLVGAKRNDKGVMPLAIAKETLRRVSEMKDGTKRVVFHGSEPLINFELIKDIIEYGKETDKDIEYSIQTNGTLLSYSIVKFLVKNGVYIGVSLDGTRDAHNITRPFINGQGSYDIVVKNLSIVKNLQGRSSFISVVTKHNVNQLSEIVSLAKELNVHSVAFNPVITDDHSLMPSEKELTENLIKVADSYFHDLLNNIKTPRIDHPERYISSLLHSQKFTNSCLLCGAGPINPLIGVDIDGTLYPCDHFWGEKDYAIGHISNISFDEASSSGKNFRNNENIGNVDSCMSCTWKRICSGGCPGGSLLNGNLQYCITTNALMNYFVGKIPELKNNGLLLKIMKPQAFDNL